MAYSFQLYYKLYSSFTSLSTYALFLFWDLIQDTTLYLVFMSPTHLSVIVSLLVFHDLDSFEEKTGAFTNAHESPQVKLNVQCEACNCTYNENRYCAAEDIHVAGMNACSCSETECNSFVPKL